MGKRRPDSIMLDPSDNVRILLMKKGSVPGGHKIATKDISNGGPIIKFGQPIGIAKKNISAGEHVHVHNVSFSDRINFKGIPLRSLSKRSSLPSSFSGYKRRDGRAGTRNYVAVIATVNCSATVVAEVARHFDGASLKSGVDGVIPVIHSEGCAQGIGGYTYEILNRTLAGWLDHPNIVGAMVIGLGCEGTTFKSIMSHLSSKSRLDRKLVESFNIQDAGGTKNAIKLGIDKVKKILSKLPTYKRTNIPVARLSVALNCGGSDAYSSITANPALGIAADMIVANGGTVVLGETPECFGGEKYLAARCASGSDRKKLHDIFSWWKKCGEFNFCTMNNNLSPGNIAGGITTILEKSLGAIEKGGSTPIKQVLGYSERITKRGLVFMDTPGFDPVSVTGMIAGGCNVVAFTTGLGSVYGCSAAPTLKISSNTAVYNRLSDDMDIDAGRMISGISIDDMARKIYLSIIAAAGGARTKSEKNGIGREEFAPWAAGETL